MRFELTLPTGWRKNKLSRIFCLKNIQRGLLNSLNFWFLEVCSKISQPNEPKHKEFPIL